MENGGAHRDAATAPAVLGIESWVFNVGYWVFVVDGRRARRDASPAPGTGALPETGRTYGAPGLTRLTSGPGVRSSGGIFGWLPQRVKAAAKKFFENSWPLLPRNVAYVIGT